MEQQPDNTSDIEKSITKYKILTTFLSVLATFTAIISIVLTINGGLLFLLGFIPLLLIIVTIFIISAKHKKLRFLGYPKEIAEKAGQYGEEIIGPFWRMAEAEAEVLCAANVPESIYCQSPHSRSVRSLCS